MALPPGSIPVLKSQGHLRHPVVPCRLAADVALNTAAAAAKSLQSCPTLCDPIDGSPPGSPPSLGFSRQEYWSGLLLPSPLLILLSLFFSFLFFCVHGLTFLCFSPSVPIALADFI